ncbi:MAG: HAD family hydrolase [Chloroflexota bacterium]
MIRGLIFDFDGLILETEGPVYQSWLELYQEFDADLPFDEWALIIGTSNIEHFDPFQRLEHHLGRSLDKDVLTPRRLQREIDLVETQPILPGVETSIAEAQRMGLKLGIASSSSRDWVAGNLTRLGLLAHFEVVHCSDDVARTKPDPALYLLALESLALRPEEAIVFEDSPNGVTAAKRAGIFCVAVPNPLTRQLPLDHADLRLDSLEDMSLREVILRASVMDVGRGV